jgi:hypothetical protein
MYRKNELDKAKLDLRRCIELPNASSATKAHSLMFLAQIAKREGDVKQARQLAEEALQIDDKVKVLTAAERAEIEPLSGRAAVPETRAAAP